MWMQINTEGAAPAFVRSRVSSNPAASATQDYSSDYTVLAEALTTAEIGTCRWTEEVGTVDLSITSLKIFGLSRYLPVISKGDFHSVLHPGDVDQHLAILSRVESDGGGYASRYRIIRPDDGVTRWIQEYGRHRRSVSPAVSSVHAVHWDVTLLVMLGAEYPVKNDTMPRTRAASTGYGRF